MRKVILQDDAIEDMMFFAKNNLKLVKKIIELIDAAVTTPFEGIGKPEPLKENLKGLWSRRIADEHRIVYEVTDDAVIVISCRSHY